MFLSISCSGEEGVSQMNLVCVCLPNTVVRDAETIPRVELRGGIVVLSSLTIDPRFIIEKPSMLFAMANLQRYVISVLLILTAAFLFLAQTSEAQRGPTITNKVRLQPPNQALWLTIGWFSRSTLISRMEMSHWVGSYSVSMERLYLRPLKTFLSSPKATKDLAIKVRHSIV